MKLAVLTAPRSFEIDDVPVPTPGDGEVQVRVAGSGVCASELAAFTGRSEPTYPLHLGHEVSGVVTEVGPDVADLDVGAPVGVWVTSHGFAEYVVVRAEYCFDAGDVPLDTALAEPLACAVNAVELADVRLGDDVLLIGAGYMGHLAQQLVALRGARRVIVADLRSDALDRALELGATHTVQVGEEDLVAAVDELTAGRGVDVTFECTGNQAGLDAIGDVTRMSGKVVLVGFHQGQPRSIPLGYWNWMAFDIRNAHFREVSTIVHGMDVGMRLLRSGAISMASHVTHRFGLDDVNAAFETALAKPPGFIKATITP